MSLADPLIFNLSFSPLIFMPVEFSFRVHMWSDAAKILKLPIDFSSLLRKSQWKGFLFHLWICKFSWQRNHLRDCPKWLFQSFWTNFLLSDISTFKILGMNNILFSLLVIIIRTNHLETYSHLLLLWKVCCSLQ